MKSIILQEIAAGAMSLEERIALVKNAPLPSYAHEASISRTMPELLELATFYYGYEIADTILIDVSPESLGTLPTWVVQLEKLIRHWLSFPLHQMCHDTEVFAEILAPWLEWAGSHMRLCQPTLPEGLLKDGLNYLAELLRTLVGRCLATDFKHFMQRMDDTVSGTYLAYLAYLHQGGLVEFFRTYPVLGKQVVLAIMDWCANFQSILTHLTEDTLALMTAGLLSSPDARPVRLKMGLSDPHNQGQTVCYLQFSDERQLIYKPRSIKAEDAYGYFMNALEKLIPGMLSHRPLSVLNRANHGWVGFVTVRPCNSRAQVASYYRRFGQLLAINYLLGIGDIHPENLVADGNEPCILDLEVCLRTPLASQLVREDGVMEAVLESVLFTNMLPGWVLLSDGQFRDQAGWSSTELKSSIPRSEWYWAAPDRIGLRILQDSPPSLHLPMLAGQHELPVDWINDIQLGMKAVLLPLLANAPLRARVQALINRAFGSFPVRFVFRNTTVYARLLERLTSPSCNTSGLRRSLEILALTEAIRTASQSLSASSRQVLRLIVTAEIQMVERNQIPWFQVHSDGTTLEAGLNRIRNAFFQDGLGKALKRIANLDTATVERQLDWTLGAYGGRFQRNEQQSPSKHGFKHNHRRAVHKQISDLPGLFAEKSAAIEAMLCRTALRNSDGSCNWMGMQPVGASGQVRLALLNDSLYDGLAGLAIYLAMRHSRGEMSPTLLTGVVLTLSARVGLCGTIGTGYGTGLGGIALALAYVRAQAVLPGLDAVLDRIAGNRRLKPLPETVEDFDLLDGLCGGIVGYLEAARMLDDLRFREAALIMAETLLDHRERAFYVLDHTYGASLAHGREGLRLVCDRLVSILPCDIQRQHCLELIHRCDFGTLPSTEVEDRVGSWCHGLVGTLASRTGVRQENLVGLVHARLGHFPGHLCCGELGRLDVLLEQTVQDRDEAARDALAQQFGTWLEKSYRAQRYPFYLYGPATLNIGLFTGLGGVGYLCERFLHPESTPYLLGVRVAPRSNGVRQCQLS